MSFCLLAALTLAGWGMVKSVGQIPDSTSKAIAAFGIATLLDPLLVFLVDVAASHYNCSQVRNLEPTVELKGHAGLPCLVDSLFRCGRSLLCLP
jgi:hypothetical protein